MRIANYTKNLSLSLHNKKNTKNSFILFSIFIVSLTSCTYTNLGKIEFNQDLAFKHLEKQVSFGPRIPNSKAHQMTVDYIVEELEKAGWKTEIQEFESNNQSGKNVIGMYGNGYPFVIVGAHFDSRMKADHELDPVKISRPVPGANDGASGVAVLLELARILPSLVDMNLHLEEDDRIGSIQEVRLVFFDLEDNGDIQGFDWIMGSQAYVEQLNEKPAAVIIVDMIGDKNLKIYKEANSERTLSNEIWKVADELGYEEHFIPLVKYSIIDDHIPFLENGIDAVDIIDFEYAYWHTTQDTVDRVSRESLKAVGETIFTWIKNKRFRQQ